MGCNFIILFLLLCNCNMNGNQNCKSAGRVHGCDRDMGSGFGNIGVVEDRRCDDCNNHADNCSNVPITPILPIVENNCNDDCRGRDDRDFDRNRNRNVDRNRNRDFDRDRDNRDNRDRNRDRDCNNGMTPPPWTRSNYSNGDTCGCEEK